MNLKNCKYMKSTEFKARQAWLDFVDAVGIVLEIMAEVKEETADWFKAWVKDFRTQRAIKKQEQMQFKFMRSISEWANWTQTNSSEFYN